MTSCASCSPAPRARPGCTTHFDLDFPRAPQQGEYWCHKHRRTCRPVESAGKFLSRYLADTLARIAAFAAVRDPRRAAVVLHGDARELELGGPYDGVVTSPPYPGLIDYHEQHRYAYELLGLDDRRERELGAAARGTSKAAIEEYVAGIAAVLATLESSSAPRRAGLHRRQRPSGALSGDPRPGGAAARRAARAPCQPPDGAAGGRVLRIDTRLSLNCEFPAAEPDVASLECSRAPSPTRSSASSRAGSRWRRTSKAASPASRSSGWPTAPARRRSIASAAGSARRSSSGR